MVRARLSQAGYQDLRDTAWESQVGGGMHAALGMRACVIRATAAPLFPTSGFETQCSFGRNNMQVCKHANRDTMLYPGPGLCPGPGLMHDSKIESILSYMTYSRGIR